MLLECILIGSNGTEIQAGRNAPKYIKFNNVFDVVKSIRKDYNMLEGYFYS